MKKLFVLTAVILTLLLASQVAIQAAMGGEPSKIYLPVALTAKAAGQWDTLTAVNAPTARHENGYVQVGGKFYLIGGRGIKPVEIYNPVANQWTQASNTPFEIHHFQAVAYNGLIYIAGAWTGPFPTEDNVGHLYAYHPDSDFWERKEAIPRPRGAAGMALYNNKLYLLGGADGGHGAHAQTVAWFDEYDLATGVWRTLPDAPHIRDHFGAAVIGDKLYAVGGRISGTEDFPNATVSPVDVYDFNTGTWSTLPSPEGDIPTPRGGSMTAVIGNEIIVTGGEGYGIAWPQTEALDATTHKWRSLTPLNQARHGSQLAECNGNLYLAAGSGAQGGSPELNTQERFFMNAPTNCLP